MALWARSHNRWKGFYPPVFDRSLDPELWYSSYISTYLERDVRQIENRRDMAAFRRFLALCAGRTAQIVPWNGSRDWA